MPVKRLKLSEDSDVDASGADHEQSDNDLEAEAQQSTTSISSLEDDDSPDTEAEIADKRITKSKKTLKRKRRATEPSQFGATLQGLLDTIAPSDLPLSLKPSIARQKNGAKLELKAHRVIQIEKKEKADKGRVRDVIGGWGGESERSLRKVAQRGVVKLFNTIQQSQVAAGVAAEQSKGLRGTGKPALPAPLLDKKPKGKQKAKHKDNIIGRGNPATIGKDDFFDMIRSGGIVSKSRVYYPLRSIPSFVRRISYDCRPNFKLQPPRTTIRKEEWERRLCEVQVTKDDLNRLIMDYLVIEGYKSAAEEFSDEANVPPPVDFESIESRMVIREALQRGDIEEAISRMNDLNPEILDTNPALYFHLQQQKLIEHIRHGRITEALKFAQDELAPRGEESPEFLAELERTMALLAFDSSSSAPAAISELLSPAQRMKTAGEVNAAILESLSQGKEVKLVQLLKLLCWSEGMLAERADFPKVCALAFGFDWFCST
ncbi:CTLH/CRA C-terminal to lish motif domain-containing protein [Suillus subaureus]|uniref:CTLH/CRA C-terminal to lish motif domain-containing protein n=1 Tax=Suillus subaureus TaxID=48587 RepID=A0A9P7EN78_9AGAM|nr:CTLH/CRA C-terminal to lish motif domain-containing protein [Suillus subaureus]KAG1825849.1 CTLH/CRA C-terminal to lish motif domain-containing protein [Suillus subaureus]